MERDLIPAALLAIALEEGADGFVVGVPLTAGASTKKGVLRGSAAHAVQHSKMKGQSVRCLAFAQVLAGLVGALGLEVIVVGETMGLGCTEHAQVLSRSPIASNQSINQSFSQSKTENQLCQKVTQDHAAQDP